MTEGLTATFHGTGRKAECAPDPDYPNGMIIDASGGRTSCAVVLDYPSPSIGSWRVSCDVCGISVVVTAAGRVDDPISVRVPCKVGGTA